jgi:hypothetical protein
MIQRAHKSVAWQAGFEVGRLFTMG